MQYFLDHSRRVQQIVLTIVALIFVTFVHFRNSSAAANAAAHSSKATSERDYGCGVHVEQLRGQEVIWEFPRKKPVGVIFFAHGCNHNAGDLWPPQPRCPHCLGLPEEHRLLVAALRRRFTVIAISSLDRIGKRCWAELRADNGRNVASILRYIIKREALKGLPLFAMGASSGGQMALTLPRHMGIKGVYAQVRGVDNAVLELPKHRQFPPTVFVHMPRDPDNAAVIGGNIETLRKAGGPVLEVQIHPRPLTVDYFSTRSTLIDESMAERIIAAMKRSGVAAENGTLLEPPRPVTEVWAPLVEPVIGNLSLTLDESHVGELINLAWAKHEIVSDEAEAIMTWLAGGGKGSLDEARKRAEREYTEVWGGSEVDGDDDECPAEHQ